MPDAEPERGDSGAFGFGDLPPRGGQPPAAAQVPAHLAEPPAVPAHLAESAGLPSRLAEPPDVPAHLAGPSGLPSRLAEPPAVPPHLAESSGLPSSLAEPPRYLGQQPEDQPSRFGEPSAGSSYFADSPIDQPPAEEPPYFAETSAPEQRESGSFFSSGSDSSFFGNGGESGASGGGSLFGSRREPAADAELDGPTEPVEYPGQVSFASGVDTLAHSGADGDGDWRDPSPELRSFFEAGATERAQLVQEEPEAPSRPGEPVYEPEIVDSAPVRLHGEIVDAEVVVPSTDSDTGSWPVGSWQANAWRQTAPQETPWEEPAPVVRPEPEPFAEWQARPASPPVVEWQPEPEPIAEWQPQPASPPVVEWQPEPEPVAEWQPQSASPPVVEWQPEPEPVAEWQPQPAADWQTPEQEPPAASPAPASSPAAAERETAPKRPDPAAIANFQSANSTEQDLFEAVQANSTDRFLSTLLLAKVLVPYWDGEGSVEPQNWRTEHMNGVPHLVVFSSQDRMEDRLGEDALGSWIKFTRLIRHWPPGDQLAFAINPESPAGAVLPGSEVIQLATWAAEMGLGVDEPEESKASSKPHEAAQPRPAFEPPASGGQLVMQKPISPEQLSYYLERNYDRVSGFVHRAGEVAHLQTPEQLYNALGLGYAGSSFKPDADESYVLRWIAYRGDLYRIPYGGSSQEAMRAMEGWVIERPPFRGNGFAPSETSDVIAEFKVDSARLPHDAELWRLRRDGRQELIARLDADGPNWRKGGAL
ncbi:SseB family protein [Dactylosporangium sp. NPDC005572]|uniref:SseB family protein n=1 Tax=Dactylosporangium sp. NPDC005572 TaxID=3156889 RepID=UPI0033A536DD